jgi:hypothetical protein
VAVRSRALRGRCIDWPGRAALTQDFDLGRPLVSMHQFRSGADLRRSSKVPMADAAPGRRPVDSMRTGEPSRAERAVPPHQPVPFFRLTCVGGPPQAWGYQQMAEKQALLEQMDSTPGEARTGLLYAILEHGFEDKLPPETNSPPC